MTQEFKPVGPTITVSSGGDMNVADPLQMDNMRPASNPGGTLGTSTFCYARVFTRAIQPDSGQQLDLEDANGSPVVSVGVEAAAEGLSFFGESLVNRPAAYTVTSALTDRAYDADTVVVGELADVVATLIADLQAYGLLQ